MLALSHQARQLPVGFYAFGVGAGPAIVDLQVAAFAPACRTSGTTMDTHPARLARPGVIVTDRDAVRRLLRRPRAGSVRRDR